MLVVPLLKVGRFKPSQVNTFQSQRYSIHIRALGILDSENGCVAFEISFLCLCVTEPELQCCTYFMNIEIFITGLAATILVFPVKGGGSGGPGGPWPPTFLEGGRNILWPPHFRGGRTKVRAWSAQDGKRSHEKNRQNVRAHHKMVRLRA